MHRRSFLKTACHAGIAMSADNSLPAFESKNNTPTPNHPHLPLRELICLFTDHLDDFGYSYADVAKMLAPLKIAGPDLTVRGGGLVPPDRLADELPKAAAAFRDQGMGIPMLTTSLTSARDPTARAILTTMDKLGIRYYKLGYYKYRDLAQ